MPWMALQRSRAGLVCVRSCNWGHRAISCAGEHTCLGSSMADMRDSSMFAIWVAKTLYSPMRGGHGASGETVGTHGHIPSTQPWQLSQAPTAETSRHSKCISILHQHQFPRYALD